MKFFSNKDKQEKNNDDRDNKKNILAFILIIIISIIIVFFNWLKGVRVTKNPSKGEIEVRENIKNSINELNNILNNGSKDIKNTLQNKDKAQSYGYIENIKYGYGDTENIDYNELLKNIKPEDIQQYIQDYNDIENTLKKAENK